MKNKISDQFTSSDPEYYGSHFSWPEDHGTENIAVIDADGSAVVVTSTINMAYVFSVKARARAISNAPGGNKLEVLPRFFSSLTYILSCIVFSTFRKNDFNIFLLFIELSII